jgi:hypothetical protein
MKRRMKKPLIICSLFMTLFLGRCHNIMAGEILATRKVDFHIAPDGSDGNPGTRTRPLATLTGARDAIREYKTSKGLPEGGVTVYLHEGVYTVSSTIEFDGRDSGSDESPIVYRAWGQDEVRIVGGIEVDNALFHSVSNPAIIKRLLPEARDHVMQIDLAALGIKEYGKIGPRGFRRPYRPASLEIFVNDEAMHIARWPNLGDENIPIGEVIDKGSVPRVGDFSNRGGVFKFNTDRPDRWKSAKDIWISGLFAYGYADDMVQVAEIDLKEKTIRTVQPTLYGFKTETHWRAWYALNLLEEIDQPGEYFIDAEAGILYLYPPASMQDAHVQISMLEEPMFALEGVSHLTFEKLTVECSRGTGFYIERGAGNQIAGCTLRNFGIMAVQMGKGVEEFKDYAVIGTGKPVSRRLGSWHEHIWINNDFQSEAGTGHKIVSCDIYNTGAGGVQLNGGNRVTLKPGNNEIVNCDIHHSNRLESSYKASINIDGVGNRIANCRIHDVPNQAIYLLGNDQIIEYNDIYRTGTHVDDGAPLYTGMDPTMMGSQIRYNYWHNNGSKEMSGKRGALIYFDCPGGQNATIHGNIFYKNHAAWGQVFINLGDSHFEIDNNIFIEAPIAVKIQACRDEAQWFEECDIRNRKERAVLVEKIDFTIPPYSERYPEYANYGKTGWYSPKNNRVRRNVAYRCGEFILGQCMSEHNLATDEDPGFVNAANGDFRLRPEAHVFSNIPGFEPVPFERMGLYRDAFRTSIPPIAPEAPVFCIGPGDFVDRTHVAFRNPNDADVNIYYTVDGTQPTTSSHLYAAPFALDRTSTVKARAFRGSTASELVRRSFRKVGIDQPVVSIVRVNFSPADAPVVQGFLTDTGETFGLRSGGIEFGWNQENSEGTRRRGLADDPLLDTLGMFRKGVSWACAVENGQYEVVVVLGDAQYHGEAYEIDIEGVSACKDLALVGGEFKLFARRVVVRDGRLTLTSGENRTGPGQTRINHLEIRRIKDKETESQL